LTPMDRVIVSFVTRTAQAHPQKYIR